MSEAKSFCISKHDVLDGYKAVKENKGAAGVDKQTLTDFEEDWKGNLYKIWNRMSSGSYFPPPVKEVELPKSDGGKRILGIPTVSDRIAQQVVKKQLEPLVEKHFHEDSYGYRPKKSALEAIGVARERCWKYNWVLDLDIKGFFDNINHELMLEMLKKHTENKWVLLYVERWLKAPMQKKDGSIIERKTGTPQGGVISPLLANIFLHYAFDEWMKENYTNIPFERYADDVICHCKSLEQALFLKRKIEKRLAEYKLELNLEKTKIVYCRDRNRKDEYPTIEFDFLGYTFRPRRLKGKNGTLFLGFNPAVSRKAIKKMRDRINQWKLHLMTTKTLKELAEIINPVVKGWINYYGKYRKSEMCKILDHINMKIVKWSIKKYRINKLKAMQRLKRTFKESPKMFVYSMSCS
jgi:RNA-directed DNA polymerase